MSRAMCTSNRTRTQANIFVNLKGKHLCSGLMIDHVHLSAVPGEKDLRHLWSLDISINQMRQPYVCREMLRRGFTSVRDCGGATLAFKQAIDDGVIQGPRLFIAGNALTQTGGHADTRVPLIIPNVVEEKSCLWVDSVMECRGVSRLPGKS